MEDTVKKTAQGSLEYSNHTSEIWKEPQMYFEHGHQDGALPTNPVDEGKKGTFAFNKTTGSFYGVFGLLGYKMTDGNTLAMMFDVPYQHGTNSNWWNAQVYKGHKEMDKSLLHELYSDAGKPFKGNNSYHEKELNEGYRVKGIMTDGEDGKIELTITK